MSKRKLKMPIEWWRIIGLVFAGAINALGVVSFLLPSGILDSGISGLSLLLANQTPLNISIYIACINLPFFLIGLKKQGFKFILCSLIAIASYSLCSFLFTEIAKLDEIMIEAVEHDMFLCAVFGAVISGIGSGLTIKFGGAIDGIEVMAVIFAKKVSLTVGQFVMVFNVILYTVACFILKDFKVGLYSIVTYAIGLKIVDFVVDGFDKGKGCIVITDHAEKVAEAISARMGRGITLINSKGYFSGADKTMMYCVVNKFEVNRLKNIISEVDPTAFVTISEISEVVGDSVSFKSKKKKKVFDNEMMNKTNKMNNTDLYPDEDIVEENQSNAEN